MGNTHQLQGLGKLLVRKQARMDISGKEGKVEARQHGQVETGTLEKEHSPTAPKQEGHSGSHNWVFFHPTGLRETCSANTALMSPKK